MTNHQIAPQDDPEVSRLSATEDEPDGDPDKEKDPPEPKREAPEPDESPARPRRMIGPARVCPGCGGKGGGCDVCGN